ncbi:MAG: response regulator [Candidatus Saccharimonadales bacterium]
MPKKILVVEDDKNLNDIYKTILTSHGYTVLTAFDGSKALDLIGSAQLDLLLLDMNLPRLGGLEVLRRARSDKLALPPTIIFSNQELPDEIDEAYRLGASRYLLKAWASPKELASVVAETLA